MIVFAAEVNECLRGVKHLSPSQLCPDSLIVWLDMPCKFQVIDGVLVPTVHTLQPEEIVSEHATFYNLKRVVFLQ